MDSSIDSKARVYLPSRGAKIMLRVMGGWWVAFGFIAACFLSVHGVRTSHTRNYAFDFFAVIVYGFGSVVLGMLLFRSGSKLSVALTTDSIRINGLFRSATLRFDEILGRRNKIGRKRIQTFLVPTSSCEQRPIKVPDVVFDEVFDKWLSSLPDLDAIDKEKRRAEGKLHWWED